MSEARARVGGAAAQSTGGFLLPLVAAVAVGALCGAINGTLVTLGRIPSIIVTLGMLYALRGVILLVTGGAWITGVPNQSRVLGMGSLFGLSAPVIVLFGLFAVMEVVGRHSTWGRDVYAVGGNRRAAPLGRAPPKPGRVFAFLLVGVF